MDPRDDDSAATKPDLASSPTRIQDEKLVVPSSSTELMHIWSDESGISHAEIVRIAAGAKPVAVTRMFIAKETSGFVDWHRPRGRVFAITLTGELEVEVGDGAKLKLPPSGLAFLEDLTGKGHITRAENAVNMFLTPPADFDLRAWARGG